MATKSVGVRFDKDIYTDLATEAETEGIPLAEYIRVLSLEARASRQQQANTDLYIDGCAPSTRVPGGDIEPLKPLYNKDRRLPIATPPTAPSHAQAASAPEHNNTGIASPPTDQHDDIDISSSFAEWCRECSQPMRGVKDGRYICVERACIEKRKVWAQKNAGRAWFGGPNLDPRQRT